MIKIISLTTSKSKKTFLLSITVAIVFMVSLVRDASISRMLSFEQVYAGGGGFNCGTAVNINVPVNECYQIQAFYTANGGPTWSNRTNRDTDTDICTWYGVGCTNLSGTNRITSILLSGNGLVGNNLSYLGSLTGLRYIDLSNNPINTSFSNLLWSTLVDLTGVDMSNTQIYGSLSTDWNTLTNLTYVNFSGNKIYGSVPGSWITSLTDRQSPYIDLTNNCIITDGYTVLEQLWLTANVTMTPQNICLVYTIDSQAGTLSGTAIQIVSSGADGTPIEVQPRSGYGFLQWSDGSTSNPRTDLGVTGTLIINADTIAALSVDYELGSGGTLSGTASQTVNSGADGTLIEAIPSSGHSFFRWSDGSTANPRIDTNVTGSISVMALFSFDTCADALNRDVSMAECQALMDLYHNTNGAGWTVATGWNTDSPMCDRAGINCGAISTGSIVNVLLSNNNLVGTLPASISGLVNLTYFDVSNNKLTGSVPESIATNWPSRGAPYIILRNNCLETAGYGITMQLFLGSQASMTPQNACLTYSAGTGGTLSGDTSQIIASGSSATSVTALGDIGYVFLQRSDAETNNPRTDANVPGGNYNIEAQFTGVTYTLTYVAGTGGTLSGSTGQVVSHGTNGTTVTAIPGSGYTFAQWSDGSTANPRTDTNVTGDKTITAQFSLATVVTNSSSVGGGDGGGGFISIDNCPGGDNSPSYYDGSCGLDETRQQSVASTGTTIIPGAIPSITKTDLFPSDTTRKIEDSRNMCAQSQGNSLSYCLADKLNLKVMKRLSLSDTEKSVSRKDMARLLSEFGLLIDKKPDTNKKCHFTDDVTKVARQVCQLDLMGIDRQYKSLDQFRPNEAVTIEQLYVILTRLMYGDDYNVNASARQQQVRYRKHIALLSKAHIIGNNTSGIATRDVVIRSLLKTLEIRGSSNA